MKILRFYLGNIFIALLAINNIAVHAQKTYYISSSIGDDKNDGQSGVPDGSHGPWKTIEKINSVNLSPGDNILFKRGDSWGKTLNIKSSGNQSSPITYGAYGSGELPKIYCAMEVTDWELYDQNRNIWRAKIGSNIPSVSQLFVNGERQNLARWPNTGWNSIDINVDNGNYISDASLIQTDNYWNGATILVRSCEWEIEERKISSSSIQRVNLNSELEYGVNAGYGYYIENKFEELDAAGEYYFDAQNHIVYLALGIGKIADNQFIEASIIESGVTINNKAYVTISNIEVEKAANNGIVCISSNNIKIQNCSVTDSKDDGIHVYSVGGKNITIDKSTIRNIDQGEGMRIDGVDNLQIINNSITDISSDLSSPRSLSGIAVHNSPHAKIQNNIIKNTGSMGMLIVDGPVEVSNNYLSNCSFTVQDNGAIYLNGNHTGSVIAFNRVKDCIGNSNGSPQSNGSTVGLYSDETAYGAVFHDNIVTNCDYGIKLHKSYNTSILNNIFYDNRVANINLHERAPNQMTGNKVHNNISFSKNSSYALQIMRDGSSSKPIGSFDDNLYYNPDNTKCIEYEKNYNPSYLGLSDWQKISGIDSGNDKHAIQDNPLFQNEEEGDFHLQQNSPCIDAGDNTYAISEIDYYGNERIWDGNMDNGAVIDIGVSEYGAPVIDNTGCNGGDILINDILTICENELPYNYHGEIIPVGSTSGELEFIYKTSSGCDSVVNLDLTVTPAYWSTDFLSIDEDELPYNYNGEIIPIGTKSGKLNFTFTSVFGCDSTVVLNLTVNSENETTGSVININLGEPSEIDGWNDFAPNETLLSNVKYSNGGISPYNFSIWNGWSSSSKGDINGSCFHENIISNYIYTSDNQIRYFTLSNLDGKKVYDIEILSSRSSYAWDERGAFFFIGTLKDSIDAKGNTCDLVTFTNIQPSEGKIKIGYRKRIADIEGYVNAIIITEKKYTSNLKPELGNQQIEILSNLAAGTPIATLEASDPDGNDVKYKILEGNEKGWFNLDETTGVLSINKAINISSNQKEELVIQVTDNSANPLSSTANISIQITFVKESQVNHKPIIVLNFNESVIGGTINDLNASSSFDLDEESLSYNWIAPEGINISSSKEADITYLAPDVSVPTTLEFAVEVSDGIDNSYKTIEITFTPFKPEVNKVDIASINASNYESNNHPVNILDGDPNTYWSANGDNNWIIVELSPMVDISHLKMSFIGMEEKQTRFDILLSKDNQNWETLYEDLTSCGFSNNMHLIDCSNVKKSSASYKYVKILGHGTDIDNLNTISELEVYGYSSTSAISDEMEHVKVYPNPASQFFIIELQEKGVVSLFDISGKIIFQKYFEKGEHTVPVDFPKGSYIILLQSDNNANFKKKLIIN